MRDAVVSSWQDMKSDWRITARAPQQFLHLAFRVQHRELGPYFVANLSLRSCSARVLGQTQHQAQHQTQHQNQLAAGSTKNRSWSRGDEDLRGLRAQRFLWLMPHQVAFWIYWQVLYCIGVHCTVLYCTVPCSAALGWAVLYILC